MVLHILLKWTLRMRFELVIIHLNDCRFLAASFWLGQLNSLTKTVANIKKTFAELSQPITHEILFPFVLPFVTNIGHHRTTLTNLILLSNGIKRGIYGIAVLCCVGMLFNVDRHKGAQSNCIFLLFVGSGRARWKRMLECVWSASFQALIIWVDKFLIRCRFCCRFCLALLCFASRINHKRNLHFSGEEAFVMKAHKVIKLRRSFSSLSSP